MMRFEQHNHESVNRSGQSIQPLGALVFRVVVLESLILMDWGLLFKKVQNPVV